MNHQGPQMSSVFGKAMAVCHNWSDEKCITVLKNCYKALEENGKVIIFEMIMPEEPDSSNASNLVSIVDNSMFLHAGGKDRTEKEFGKLSKDDGEMLKFVLQSLRLLILILILDGTPQAALVKDPGVSINRVIWSPDGALFGVAYSRHIVQIYSYHGGDEVRQHLEI
ncbi:hypothetical protein AHAS_Ahas09G0301800 [Arachis hypogaea]